MKLSNCEMRPGKVIAVCNNYGTIKAVCCGLFSEDNIDNLPPIYPLLKISNSYYCEPQIGDLIWVIFDTTNPLELFYIFQGDTFSNNGDILSRSIDSGSILYRDTNSDSSLQWNDQEGWLMDQQDSRVQIDPNGDINISKEDKEININDNGIQITTGHNSSPAVLGNELKIALQDLIEGLQNVSSVAKSHSITTGIGIALDAAILSFNSKLSNILSRNITID